jgi:hypothetical protein
MQMGSEPKTADGQKLRHAFAGHGTLFNHYSWLLSGDGGHANTMFSTTMNLLNLRRPARLDLNVTKLQEQGIWLEERRYIKMQRGIATAFVYVAPAGQDLYISRTTTVLPPFDVTRVVLLIAMIAEVFLRPYNFFSIGNYYGDFSNREPGSRNASFHAYRSYCPVTLSCRDFCPAVLFISFYQELACREGFFDVLA